MENQINLIDIANDLVIINKHTINTLFSLENGADCISLYVFYYKTAKWQQTNVIKANDDYVKKSLKWGIDRIQKTKDTLKEKGLIKIVKKVKPNGLIEGWYVEISYLVNEEKIETIHNTQKPQVVVATSGNEETNALIYKIKLLEEEILKLNNIIKELKENNTTNSSIKESEVKPKKEKEPEHHFGTYGRIMLTTNEYNKLCDDFTKNYIDNVIEKLDEYVEMNNNKNKYKKFNLVIRKAIRENWSILKDIKKVQNDKFKNYKFNEI